MKKFIFSSVLLLFQLFAADGLDAKESLDTMIVEQPSVPDLVVERYELTVKENRSDPNSRDITIGYGKVQKSPSADGKPIFLIAGGPGGSFNERLESSGNVFEDTLIQLNVYREVGDVYLVDLRGINLSKPNIACEGAPDRSLVITTEEQYLNLLRDAAAACRSLLLQQGFDLDGYNVLEAAQDIIDVADAHGLDKIHVAGRSFGSHLGLTVARYHSDRVERMLLAGIEGFDHTIDDVGEVGKAVSKISAQAADVWNGAQGFSNPIDAYQDLIMQAELAQANSQRGPFGLRPYELRLFAISGNGYSLSSRRGMVDWPSNILDYVSGNVRNFQLARLLTASLISRGGDAAAVGLFDCSSWISEARAQRLKDAVHPFLFSNYETHQAVCSGWNVTRLPEEFRIPSSPIDVDTLFIQGDVDTSTPLSNAFETLEMFPNGNIIQVTNGSHDVLTEMLMRNPIYAQQIISWFNSGEVPNSRYRRLALQILLRLYLLPPIQFN